MGAPSLDRLAGPCATAVGLGGLLYGLLFAWIVAGPPGWVPEVWFALLILGAVTSVPVGVALYQRLRKTDEGLALTALLLGLGGAFGGAVHGAFNLASQVNPASVGTGASPDPGGIFRYAVAGIALMLVGWLVMAGRTLPARWGQLALASGAILVFIYVGRLYDFITPDERATLIPPFLYGLVLHPALYLWLGRLLRPRAPVPPVTEPASAEMAA
ncbi:MAG: hypothetical protein LC733_04360 [Actinobacteria bacterium]|nr:hypothetical protein [Actinomycetota bacterium]